MRTILTFYLLHVCHLMTGIGVFLLAPEPLLAQNSEALANQLDRLQRDVEF